MPGVPRELIEHEFHDDPNAKQVKQRLGHFSQDKKKDVILYTYINETHYKSFS
jgi:hypothetical protein